MADIIVDVPAGYTGRVHIVIHNEDTASTDPEVIGNPEDLAGMVKRFSDFEPGPHQEIADKMAALGYQGHLPKARKGSSTDTAYIRWVCNGSARTVRLYQNSKGLVSDSKKQLDFAKTAPGASPVAPVHEVRYYFDTAGKDVVLKATEAFREYADTE